MQGIPGTWTRSLLLRHPRADWGAPGMARLGRCPSSSEGGQITTMDGVTHWVDSWDLLIAHPPCTYLSNCGAARLFKRVDGKSWADVDRLNKGFDAKEFFLEFLNAPVEKICVENPIPSSIYRLPKYTQVIQPYEHGHPYSKKTCLWLKGLKLLDPTKIVEEHTPWVNGGCKDAHGNYRKFQGRKERDPKTRAKTFPGVAAAMASQWG